MLFTWSAASEATRAGARFAVVCDDTTKRRRCSRRCRQCCRRSRTSSTTWIAGRMQRGDLPGRHGHDDRAELPVDLADRGPRGAARQYQCRPFPPTCRANACGRTRTALQSAPETRRTPPMKIAIISPNAQHLQTMSKVLEARSHKVTCVEGGKGRMRQVADQEKPQLMLVDGMCCDPDELTLIEDVTTRHPDVAVMLLCASQTSEFLIHSMRAGVREVLPVAGRAGGARSGHRPARRKARGPAARALRQGAGLHAVQGRQRRDVHRHQLRLRAGRRPQEGAADRPEPAVRRRRCRTCPTQKPARRCPTSRPDRAPRRLVPRVERGARGAELRRAGRARAIRPQAMDVKPEHIDAILKLARHAVRLRACSTSAARSTTLASARSTRPTRSTRCCSWRCPTSATRKRCWTVFRSLGYAARQDRADRQPLRKGRRDRA